MARMRTPKAVVVESRRMQTKGVAIDELDAFRKDLAKLKREGGPDGLALLKDANYRVAEHVRVRAMARAAGISRMHARAGADLKSSKAANKATLTGGGRVPWFNAAEFGVWLSVVTQRRGRKELGGRNGPNYATGRTYQRNGRTVRSLGWVQFAKYPWQEPGHGRTGYFLFPTMRAESEAIKEMYLKELDDICKIAFPFGRL